MKTFENYSEFMLCLNLARQTYAEMKGSYDSDVAAYSAQGYRAHYCIHGTDLWTDYDNICYGCEEGVTLLNMAVHSAAASVVEFRNRISTMMDLMSRDLNAMGVTVDKDKLAKWTTEPVKGILS